MSTANLILRENASNFSNLHSAVCGGSLEAVKHFLDAKADVNATDGSGNTPLLLAICIEQEDVYNEVVRMLIERGADVNIFNKGFTPLYNAAFYKRQESVRMLLEAGAWLRPTYTNELHLLAEIGGSNILIQLLNDPRCTPEIINSPNENDSTALHMAAQFLHKNCLRMLIQHGGDLTAVNGEGYSVLDIIFERFINPEGLITGILDENIVVEQMEKYKQAYVIDFSILAPKNCARQMEVISNMLVAASEEEKMEVLQHPLIELYLILKWKKICYFFYLWIGVYVIFAVSMALFINLIIHKYHHTIIIKVVKWVLILCSTGLLGHAVLQCILTRRNYLQRFEMWMNLICTCLSLTVAITADEDDISGTDPVTPNWVLHVTSIAVLLAWIELMLLIGRLPSLGYYALMFSEVLQNVVKVMAAFLCLIIGFALSFSIQFCHNPQFSDPWRALIKTMVMMTGEYEYADIFTDDPNQHTRLPATSRFIFLIFIFLTSIALMNLMVGVAVSDIQHLQRQGRAKKLEKQAEFLCQLEKVIASKQLNSKYVPSAIKKLFVRRSFIDTKYKMRTSTEFHRAERIPWRVIESITSLARKRRKQSLLSQN